MSQLLGPEGNSSTLIVRWVKALRSGKYKQNFGSLKCVDSYCCLGVLCDISGVGKWSSDDSYITKASSHKGTLPYMLLSTTTGEFNPSELDEEGHHFYDDLVNDYYTTNLVSLNDDLKLSFEQIATLIEHIERCHAWVA